MVTVYGVAAIVFLLIACHKPAAQTFGTAVPGPANPVVPVDPSGNYPASFTTTGAGGYVTIDGGTVTANQGTAAAASGAWPVSIVNDAGNMVPVDPQAGLALNTLVVQPVPAVQQVLIDAGTRCITDINYTNEGTVTGYAQVFCGQYVTDAGGTAGAATVPSLQLRCPAGTVCGIKLEAPLCCAGATWYSGVDAGFLLTTSAPAMTLTAASLR